MKKKHLPDDASPLYGSLASGKDVVLKKLRKKPISAHIAYQLIKDQLIDEGNARQNLATFCQTYMEPEVTKINV